MLSAFLVLGRRAVPAKVPEQEPSEKSLRVRSSIEHAAHEAWAAVNAASRNLPNC